MFGGLVCFKIILVSLFALIISVNIAFILFVFKMLFIYLFDIFYLFICLFIYLFIYLFVCLFVVVFFVVCLHTSFICLVSDVCTGWKEKLRIQSELL